MYKILVIGKSSFIGNNFKINSNFKNVDLISIKEKKLEDINFVDYEIVIHLAAIVHQTSKIEEQEYFRVNKDLSVEVAKASKNAGIKQFIFLSTVKVYGGHNKEKIAFNEKTPCNPEDVYGRSKYEAEIGLRDLENKNFKVAILRTPLVYGEGVKANMLKMMKMVEKLSFLPFDKINNRRSITYVGNLVGYMDQIIKNQKSGTFIAQDENPVSTTELVKLIAGGFSKRIKLKKIPKLILRAGSIIFPNIVTKLFESLEFDNTFTKDQLNYHPTYTTKEGIERMVKAYLNKK